MSLDEKIGQMVELEIEMITYNDPSLSKEENVKRPFRVDETALDSVINKHKVGSILNAPRTTAQTPTTWNYVVKTIQDASMRGLGIPTIYGLDQMHGTTYTAGGTLFPGAINMAATFNRDLVRKMGEIVAYETRACNVPWIYGPDIDLGRMQAWSRQYEGFGEDVYLTSEMGAAALRGMQGDDPNHIDRYHVAGCLKHYFAYGAPYNGLDRSPIRLSYEELREKQFAPFLRGFREGALSVMTNSANVNGVKGLVNREFLTGWLKEGLQWDGMIVTDWGDIDGAVNCDHVAPNVKETICMAINAGVDMMMVPSQFGYGQLLKELIAEGRVSMERIDDAVSRILRLKYRLGLFDQPNTFAKDYPLFGSEEFAEYSRQAALESIVLLKNEQVLPIQTGKKMLVTGPNANSMRTLNGGWSYTWQGDGADREEFTGRYNTIYEALTSRFGRQNVTLVEGVSYDSQLWAKDYADHISDAVEAAKDVDYIVACIGENSYAETRGNIADLNLSPNQKALIRALAATGKPIIMVLNESRGRVISDIEPLAQAVVHTMLPGNYGGDALARLLAGDENFSGRLPYTYPAQTNAMVNYDYKASEVRETIPGVYDYNAKTYEQWWFGAGMSYTTYEYSNLHTDKTDFDWTDELTITVDVKNTGRMAGKEVVMLYSSDLYASMMPDNRRLRRFEKISLQPGETKTVTFRLPVRDLAFIGQDGQWTLESGEFRLSCGGQSLMLTCTDTHVWEERNIPN